MKLIANRTTAVIIALAATAFSLGCYTTAPYGYESPAPAPGYYGGADLLPWSYGGSVYVYSGHHPHSHYEGRYCYVGGRHHHDYPPSRRHAYRSHGGVHFYTGSFGRSYNHRGDHRDRYAKRGSRGDYRDRDHRDRDRQRGEIRHQGGNEKRHRDRNEKPRIARLEDRHRENPQQRQPAPRIRNRRNEPREKTNPTLRNVESREPRTRTRRDSRRSGRDRDGVDRVSRKPQRREQARTHIKMPASERRRSEVRSAGKRESRRAAVEERRSDRRRNEKKKSEIGDGSPGREERRAKRPREGAR